MKSVNRQHPLLFRLVIAHYLLAAVCFVAIAIMLQFVSEDLNGHYFQPKLLAITHTAALGWGSLMIFGACYQLLPVVLETELYSYKIAWLSFGLFCTGLVLFVCAFWNFDPGLCMQAGSILLLAGILLFAWNTFITSSRTEKHSIYQDFITTACIWLLATAILGTLMVFNFRFPFLPKDHLLFLKLHAHMGIGGWFLLLIIGVSSKLIPMFLVSTKQNTACLSWSYYLINAALVSFLVDTYLYGVNMKTYIVAVAAIAGVICWLIFIAQCVKSRMRKAFDMPVMHTFLSFFLLTLSLVALPFIVFYQIKGDGLSVKSTNIYGTLVFMGWISAIILGQTFKTLPFIVWIKRYQHLAGKETTPLPADLFSKRLLSVQFYIFLVFNAGFYAGLFFHSDILLKLSLLWFLLTAVIYLLNVLIVILHKSKTKVYGNF
ncbi:hypothetical protein [Desertivirga xinjiangensis]|uniref:hypothetical protein n=1 Tax=Desertivirga xinjiangensis TaxID=539206 RepID=UPI00210D5320|nr:hypothetical protein [Pedobacter xinjiangensis]